MQNPTALNIVLIEPEIPQNTGTIGRLCVAIQSTLHLIEPLGFDISDSAVKRAGLDYWKHLQLKVHKSLEAFIESLPRDAELFLLSKKANQNYFDLPIPNNAYLLFGKETAGIPEWLLAKYPTRSFRIPMFDARVRSLNLSNAVSIVAYEAIRQGMTSIVSQDIH